MVRIGTSGWTYDDWSGRFYPPGVPRRLWLPYYAERFDTVELNATTYRLPKESHVRQWCEAVPPDFIYTVKLSRLITHRKTISDRVPRFVDNFMQRIDCFAPAHLGQILVQFPPYLERDDGHLREFLDMLPKRYRYAVEFRERSWLVPEVERILRDRSVAFCIHDYPGVRTPDLVTSPSLAYVRLHGYTGLYVGHYPRRSLQHWARRIRNLALRATDVFVYFNNDTRAAAPHDATVLREILAST